MTVVDTQAVLWLNDDVARLSREAERVLVEGRLKGTLAISGMTLREIAMLVHRGRVTLQTPLDAYLIFLETLFTVLPITARIAAHSVRFSSEYPKDPADRLIGATANVHGAVLVTSDEHIRASGEVKCVW